MPPWHATSSVELSVPRMDTLRPLASGPLRQTFLYMLDVAIISMKRDSCSPLILCKSSAAHGQRLRQEQNKRASEREAVAAATGSFGIGAGQRGVYVHLRIAARSSCANTRMPPKMWRTMKATSIHLMRSYSFTCLTA